MALHRVVKFEATADILGTIRRVCYDLDEQRLVIETINLEEAMVMLHRLEAAAPAKVTIPSTEVDLVAALEAAAINEPRPSFEHAATVTITTQTPVPTIAMTPVEASIEVPVSIPASHSGEPIVEQTPTPREEQAKHGQTNEEIHPADAPPTIVAPANPTPEVPVATLPKPVVAKDPAKPLVSAVPKTEPVTKTSGSATHVVRKRQRVVRDAEAPASSTVDAIQAKAFEEAKAATERELARQWLKDNAEEVAKPPQENNAGGNGTNIQKDFAKVKDDLVGEPIPGESIAPTTVPITDTITAPTQPVLPGSPLDVATPTSTPQTEEVNENGIPLVLINSTSLREVLAYLASHGVTSEQEVLARCVALKPHIGVIDRIINLEERVRRALSLLQ